MTSIKCPGCNKEKEKHAKGKISFLNLCHTCYTWELRNKRNVTERNSPSNTSNIINNKNKLREDSFRNTSNNLVDNEELSILSRLENISFNYNYVKVNTKISLNDIIKALNRKGWSYSEEKLKRTKLIKCKRPMGTIYYYSNSLRLDLKKIKHTNPRKALEIMESNKTGYLKGANTLLIMANAYAQGKKPSVQDLNTNHIGKEKVNKAPEFATMDSKTAQGVDTKGEKQCAPFSDGYTAELWTDKSEGLEIEHNVHTGGDPGGLMRLLDIEECKKQNINLLSLMVLEKKLNTMADAVNILLKKELDRMDAAPYPPAPPEPLDETPEERRDIIYG